MTVSISRMDIRYYLSTISASDGTSPKGQLTGYYTESGDPDGKWYGKGLKGLSLKKEEKVSAPDAISIYEEARHPKNGKSIGNRPMKDTKAPAGAKTASGKSTSKTRKAVAGFDLTFSVPKSVSVLWAISDNSTQARIHKAHQEAVRKTLDWAESNVIQTRSGHGGVVKVGTKGLIASLFDHYDSRAGDPQLHTHAVIANRVQRASDGQWLTLDSYALHKSVVTISEMYNAVLFDELANSVAAEAEQRDPLMTVLKGQEASHRGNDRVELAGVPDELIAEFSQRVMAIEERKDELVKNWEETHGRKAPENVVLDFRRQATIETREEKQAIKLPLNIRMTLWRSRAYRRGFSPEQIIREATGRNIDFYSPASFTPNALAEIANEILDRTITRHPTFTRQNLLASAHRLTSTIRFADLEERDQVTNQLVELALSNSVELSAERYKLDHLTEQHLSLRGRSVFNQADEKVYTTSYVLEQEEDLMQAVTSRTTPTHVTDKQAAKEDLEAYTSEEGHHLAPDQLEAAHQVMTSDRHISAIIGPAGTGKTSTLAGLRQVWEKHQGHDTIIGLAPSAAAASVLGKELGIATDNVAKWIYESAGEGASRRAERYNYLKKRISTLEARQLDNPDSKYIRQSLDSARTKLTKLISEQAKYQIRPGQLLIIDEASMISTEDLSMLYQQTKAAGAKLLLVGDPKQLDAVDAGGFLGWMENKGHASHLTSVWRFKADWEKTASLALRLGDTEILKTYQQEGRITEAEDALESAYSAWLADQSAGKSSVLIAGRNDQVQDLNARAQAQFLAEGKTSDKKKAPIRTGEAYIGDTILARLNNRQLLDSNGDFIKNGTRLKITKIQRDTIQARREDTGATITIPADYARESVELGYACTIHRSQGLTVDTCHVAIDTSYNREQLYVAMTRGKENNQIHINAEPDPEQLPDSPDPWKMMQAIVSEEAMEVLTGIMHKSDVDKTAHEVQEHEHGWAKDLGRALSELEYLTEASTARRVSTWVEQTLGQPAETYSETPTYKALLLAAKQSEADVMAMPSDIKTLEAATDYLKERILPLEQATDLIPDPKFLNAQETEAFTQIKEHINDRIDAILYKDRDEEWQRHMGGSYPFGQKSTHRQIVMWRALAGQEDEASILGQKPQSSDKRLSRYYRRLEIVLKNLKTQDRQQMLYDLNKPDTGEISDGEYIEQSIEAMKYLEKLCAEVLDGAPPAPDQTPQLPAAPAHEAEL